jgi:very-short-patch-repair endonuclease
LADRGSLGLVHEHDQNTERARALRKQSTLTEDIVWRWLRNRRFGDWKFRRQYPIVPYIADFYCDALKLIIEIDGQTHDFTFTYDERRAAYLAGLGIETLRIDNRDVLRNSNAAAEVIDAIIVKRSPLTRRFAPPSPGGRGTKRRR